MYKALLVPFSYSSGINQWRDQLKPSQILQNVARVKGIPPPNIEGDGSSLSFSGKLYNLQDFGTTCHYLLFVDLLLLLSSLLCLLY